MFDIYNIGKTDFQSCIQTWHECEPSKSKIKMRQFARTVGNLSFRIHPYIFAGFYSSGVMSVSSQNSLIPCDRLKIRLTNNDPPTHLLFLYLKNYLLIIKPKE